VELKRRGWGWPIGNGFRKEKGNKKRGVTPGLYIYNVLFM